jgi:DNA-binding NarL/FixJ family response regulator
MTKQPATSFSSHMNPLPPLPMGSDHWQAIFEYLRLSQMQIEVATLLLRGDSRKQIADAFGITEPTIMTYLDRIYARTGASGPMQLAMRTHAVSHDIARDLKCRSKR